jgi:tetratricopeptide (TPR) repeat protein
MNDYPEGGFAADARAGEAWSDYSLRRVAEAAAGFEEAAGMASDENERLSLLYDAGCAWREAGDAQKAAAPLAEVAKVGDHELAGLAWFRLGTLWQEQARVARGRSEAAAAEDERTKFAETQKKFGSEAIQYFSRALSLGGLGGEEIEARSLLGEVQLDAGRFEDAAKTFAEVAERWPDSDRAPWALYHQALSERELSRAAEGKEAEEHLAAAAAALRKSLERENAKTRLQAAWARADYRAALGDRDGAREGYRWLASDGVEWAKNWRDASGNPDPALENRARG